MSAQDGLNLLYAFLAGGAIALGLLAAACWPWRDLIVVLWRADPLDKPVKVQTLNFMDGSKVVIKDCPLITQVKWSPAPRPSRAPAHLSASYRENPDG